MRIRLLKACVSPLGHFRAGDTTVVPDHIGEDWVKTGLAMEDKAMDAAPETKVEAAPKKRKAKRSKK